MSLRVVAPDLAWTREGDLVVVGGRVKWRAWAETVLEGARAGEALDELDARAAKALPDESADRARRLLRNLLFTLHQEGLVRIPVEAPAVLRDRYEVGAELGRGGIGVAFAARDRTTGERVVAKRAWPFYGTMEKVEPSLRAEADLLARFDSPRVIRRVDAVEADGVFWLVRAFADGPSLDSLAGKVTDPTARASILHSAGEALAHLHARGFVLVSVRPPNFHVAGAAATLVDVGHAREAPGGIARLARRHGTPGWTAPEVESARTATAATDVWGLARLAEFLAGDAATAREREFVARAGAADPAARPASVADALALL